MTLTDADRLEIATEIRKRIDAFCVEKYGNDFRWHLGASLIGEECPRYLWYSFRWAFRTKFNGRMLRLFNRGHREEERLITYLRGIGIAVRDLDDDGKQMRMTACEGHFGGSQDGDAQPPAWLEKFREALAPVFLVEFKTQGTGSKFVALCNNGVEKEKPRHFAQMSIYGKARGYRYALYFAVNKNDDSLHVEVVPLDWKLADDMERKAQDIILSPVPPRKLHENPAMFGCKFCDAKQVCHYGEAYEKNCRSCVQAVPNRGGEWFCKLHGDNIPREFVPNGCDSWTPNK